MGLFSSNYNRPGPGVRKDEPVKKPFFRFFEIFFRKLGQLVQLNLIFCIPVIVAAILMYFLSMVTNLSFLAFLPLILISPFVAGLTIVTRNYAREEHSFIFSDFIDAVKNNWAAFLLNGVVCYAVYFIFNVAITYYTAQLASNNIFFIPLALCIGISILFIFSQFYIPVMIVTFDLKLSLIYKNAFIFSIIGLWRNLLLTVLMAIILLGLFVLMYLMPLTIMIALLLAAVILFSFCMFLINFTVYPLIYKNMILPFQKENENTEVENTKENIDFKD